MVSQREMLMRCGQQDGKRRNTGHRYRTARQKLLLRSWTGNAVLERRTLETKSYAVFSRCQFGVLGSTSCLVTSSGEKSFLPDSNSLVFLE